jgi:hypothetical protein
MSHQGSPLESSLTAQVCGFTARVEHAAIVNHNGPAGKPINSCGHATAPSILDDLDHAPRASRRWPHAAEVVANLATAIVKKSREEAARTCPDRKNGVP